VENATNIFFPAFPLLTWQCKLFVVSIKNFASCGNIKIMSLVRFTKVEKGCDAFAKLKAVGGTTQCGKFFLGTELTPPPFLLRQKIRRPC
jgi:hypothetical protein